MILKKLLQTGEKFCSSFFIGFYVVFGLTQNGLKISFGSTDGRQSEFLDQNI